LQLTQIIAYAKSSKKAFHLVPPRLKTMAKIKVGYNLTGLTGPKPNTDNKGKLFVTLFAFLPAGRQVPLHSRQICNSLYHDRASTYLKALYTLTCSLLAINFVLRHSYSSTNFVPGRQKMRHTFLAP
jgi:hypothetical protein